MDGGELHQDVELFTPHYRGAHAASRARTGFRIYSEEILVNQNSASWNQIASWLRRLDSLRLAA